MCSLLRVPYPVGCLLVVFPCCRRACWRTSDGHCWSWLSGTKGLSSLSARDTKKGRDTCPPPLFLLHRSVSLLPSHTSFVVFLYFFLYAFPHFTIFSSILVPQQHLLKPLERVITSETKLINKTMSLATLVYRTNCRLSISSQFKNGATARLQMFLCLWWHADLWVKVEWEISCWCGGVTEDITGRLIMFHF